MKSVVAPTPDIPAKRWSIGGFYAATHILDINERPLTATMRIGEKVDLWCLPQDWNIGPLPDVRWVSTRPEIARLTVTYTAAALTGVSEGETEVYAIVDAYGGTRADLNYYCCGDCAEHALPRCESIPIRAVRVLR